MGSTTQGIFSSILDKELPNAWKYDMSVEAYQDVNGENHENIGITAAYLLNYAIDKDVFLDNSSNDLLNRKDKPFNLVLKLKYSNPTIINTLHRKQNVKLEK